MPRKSFVGLVLATLVFGAVGCDCSGPTRIAPCAMDGGPGGCGQACSATVLCPSGTYCGPASVCTADCSPAVACEGGGFCINGRCAPGTDTGPVPDTSWRDAPPIDTTCAAFDLDGARVTPNVVLIIDRSGSMDTNDFPDGSGVSRWNALRDGLMDVPDGIVDSLQSSVRFGLAMYTEEDGECPALGTVPCALDNYDGIDAVYGAASPAGGTPTGDSITALLGMLDTVVSEEDDPTIFVLATDGEPDTCEDGDDEVNGRLESIAAVESAFDMGIRTFVISVGDDVAGTHLQDVANAGLGVASGAEFWVVTDTAGLSTALEDIIGGVVDCEISLSGTIDPSLACTGTVRFGTDVIPCDDPDGWHAIDGNTIELTGDACDRLQAGGEEVSGTFPCDAVVF